MSRFVHAHRRIKSAYVGPVEVRETPQGRGMVATRDIRAGELLLAERPLIAWEGDTPVEVQGAIAALKDTAIWKAVSDLHPRSLDDASPEAIGSARRRFGPRLFEQEPGFNERLRLVLCMQFNAFEQGIFKRLSMFNHSCGWAANSVRVDAEVYAIKRIERGTEVTFSYEYPVESATVRRRRRLRAKYDFDCNCLACRALVPEHDEAAVEDMLRDVTDLDSAHDALVDAIATLGDDAPLTLRARRALVAQTPPNDNVALVERALDLRHHEIKVLGADHLEVASTDLIAADALQRALTTSWNLHKMESCIDATFPRVGGSLAIRLEHLEFCLRTSAENITRKYRG